MVEKEEIKTIDLKIKASGFGIVNWNTNGILDKNKNHKLPKLKHFNALKDVNQQNIEDATVFVSQNCFKSHLFKDDFLFLDNVNETNIEKVLLSFAGIVKGYVFANSVPVKRKSCLFLEDFVTDFNGAEKNNGKVFFEQFSRVGSKGEIKDFPEAISLNETKNNTIFSAHNLKDVVYEANGFISIDTLRFISFDNLFDRACILFKTEEKKDEFVNTLNENLQSYKKISKYSQLNPIAEYHLNWNKIKSILDEGESGVLLNDDAIKIILTETLINLKGINFSQGDGFFKVDDLLIDFNTSSKLFRFKENNDYLTNIENDDYLTHLNKFYFENKFVKADEKHKLDGIERRDKEKDKKKK